MWLSHRGQDDEEAEAQAPVREDGGHLAEAATDGRPDAHGAHLQQAHCWMLPRQTMPAQAAGAGHTQAVGSALNALNHTTCASRRTRATAAGVYVINADVRR